MRILEDFPDPGGPVPLVLACRRHANHPGSHLAEGVESLHADRARWIRWNPYLWRIFDAGYCGPRSDRAEHVIDELDWCYLRRRHRGPHSFDYVQVEPGAVVLADDYPHLPG